jgi:hypothetical protein
MMRGMAMLVVGIVVFILLCVAYTMLPALIITPYAFLFAAMGFIVTNVFGLLFGQRSELWYVEGAARAFWVCLGVSVVLTLVWQNQRETNRSRARLAGFGALIVLCLGAGLYVGIRTTASGYYQLPLGVMQEQMHDTWGVPTNRLEPPP